MKPELHRIGERGSPVVVIDDFSQRLPSIVAIAAGMTPFPKAAGNHYPGVRRMIDERHDAAFSYVQDTLRGAAPMIGGAFDLDAFDLIEASFSIVTAAPATLTPEQRAPHFDSIDPDYIAILHYLSDIPGSGTAFYRQRETGIELVDRDTVSRFVATARRDAAARPAAYIDASDRHFERIGLVEGIADRLVVYRGSLLHSGIVPPGMLFSDDPRAGRLTANLFVQGRRP